MATHLLTTTASLSSSSFHGAGGGTAPGQPSPPAAAAAAAAAAVVWPIALRSLQRATLDGCAPLVLRGMGSWEDSPVEDAAAMAECAVSYLRLAALLPPSLQPSLPQPQSLARGLMGLLRLQRAARHADLLRLQGLVLPLLPPLCALRAPSEILPMLRSATRHSGTRHTTSAQPPSAQQTAMGSIAPNVALPQAGMLLAAALTATAMISCCHVAQRQMPLELCLTPQVIISPAPPCTSLTPPGPP